ncbi:MAG: helicase-related protein [Sulfuricaulis sp.]
MNKFEQARAELLSALRKYLVGPLEGEEEVISESPRDRYHVGILAPSGSEIPPEEDDQDDSGDAGGPEAASSDGILALANVAWQAAAGMTFQVPSSVRVLVDLSFADYVPQPVASGEERAEPKDKTDANEPAGTASRARQRIESWRRKPRALGRLAIPEADEPGDGRPSVLGELDGVQVVAIVRRVDNVRMITVSVVNRRVATRNRKEDQDQVGALQRDPSIYQVSMRAYHADGEDVFVARPPGIHISDDDAVAHEVLYRNVKQFAVGHGCAVDWALSSHNSGRATEIRTEWIPAVEVYKASAGVDALANSRLLSVDYLADTHKRIEICAELGKLPAAYAEWIASIESSAEKVVESFDLRLRARVQAVIAENVEQCRRVHDRLVEGVGLLGTDDDVFEAFRMANAAMALSMRRSRRNVEPRWYPFQLAFILMTLASTSNPGHRERQVMDLIWFPTGGGKTEAYLGLVAFVLFHRRLAARGGTSGGGTAVLTRYTLRLLTVQQFERATRTIMACELLRRSNPDRYGREEFTIGLFVGNTATPGTLDTAKEIISGSAQPDETATTLPLEECPWCGHVLEYGYQTVTDKTVVTRCPGKDCDFHEGIPFGCVDEHLYNAPPSMIIGTVDKFAMMAWEPRIKEFFGNGDVTRDPPSLIIQDELHLIGDALGTVTALYETAVDSLCSRNQLGPKIIGSTATIRRAGEQIKRIYARRLQQFPPSGIDYNDSFFYSEDRTVPGRLYVGVHAQGRSPKYTLARVTGILAQGSMYIQELPVRDQYHTVVQYFNSLRELGGAIVLAYDDVRRYIDSMPCVGPDRRKLGVIQELTSYIPSREIKVVLKRIARGITDNDEDSEPIDLLLSTNMISVGVDVERLGVMIVNGQPKTTSEYIQASSRVGRGRGSAGLVVTLYNWTRPRDRSHYERFRAYHQSFYRYVEATSVTPFSARARDRALHGVLFALARLRIPELEESPGGVVDPAVRESLESLCNILIDRAELADESEVEHTRNTLNRLLTLWEDAVQQQEVTWRKEGKTGKPYFLCQPNRLCNDAIFDATPQSMRDVDPPCPVQLLSVAELTKRFDGGQR